MKKITAGILTAAMVIALGGATVSAVGLGQAESGSAVQDRDRTQEQIYKNTGGNCIYYEEGNCRADSDGDGVCDYHENGVCLGDSDGDGICDYRENAACPADSDGDGTYDCREAVSGTASAADGTYGCGNGWHHSSGCGKGAAHGYGHGHGCR